MSGCAERRDRETLDLSLLDLLCCPETHQKLSIAEPGKLEQLNTGIAAGSLRNVAGVPVREPLSQALLREDGAVAYPIRRGIPLLIAEEAIPAS